MDGRRELMPGDSIPDTALECVFGYMEDGADRSAISRVCKKWYAVDRRTRKMVTIACCYAIQPAIFTQQFQALETVKIKGKPRAAMFRLIPEDWGGYAKPWISEIAGKCPCLKSIHLRRMIVTDEDLFTLAKECGHMLQVLKLDKCSDFSTIGLEAITKCCRSLRVLFLEESLIEDHGGNWLHQLARYNSSLEVLNFSGTDLQSIEMADLLTLAGNCKSLVSLKLNDTMELEALTDLLSRARGLRELGGFTMGAINGLGQCQMSAASLPRGLTSLVGLCYMGTDEGDKTMSTLVQPIATGLKKIDLQCAFLSVDGHCQLLSFCTNLENLEVFNAIGDEGLEVVATNCKNLRRLRVERGDSDVQQGFVTQKGLSSVASSCHNLEYIAVYISDINNAALISIAQNCPKLKDFRLVLLDEENEILDYPLDEGVRTLIIGCPQIHRLALYLRPGFMTDKGMEEIGRYGLNLKWVLFGLLGETDNGLSLFANGCPRLERLEIRDCIYTEAGIAAAVMKMGSLKYVWVQGYKSSGNGRDLLNMKHACWNVEFIPSVREIEGIDQPTQFLAYRSLAERRTDNPRTVICL